jgi:hypothetical protein
MRIVMRNFIYLPIFMLILSLPGLCSAKAIRYGLLVGVSNYPTAALEGPINDVSAMKQVLVKRWGFLPKNIKILIDETSTKKNILKELDLLYKKTKKGDGVFIYLSGHGTSARDRSLNFPLPTTSGAFIPYDVRDAKTKKQAYDKLLVGKSDLKPALLKLDAGDRQVFVAIDACYSGNAVRGVMNKKADQLPARFLDLDALLPGRGFGDDLVNTGSNVWEPSKKDSEESYPYKNIYYLSASGEHEQAKDIPARMLKFRPTIDGKAHGAYTDTLLRVLDDPSLADVNRDDKVSYKELTKAVRKMMRTRGFDHTPNGLPTFAEDVGDLSSRGILRPKQVGSKSTKRVVVKANKKHSTYKQFSLHLGNEFASLSKQVKKISNIRLVQRDADISLRRKGKEVILVSRAGDIVTRMQAPDTNKLVETIKVQAWIHQLVDGKMKQDFGVYLGLYGSGLGSVLVKGEEIGFSITSDREAYLLIVDIDPKGSINVIYPYYKEELDSVPAKIAMIKPSLGRVSGPFGRDYVQVYAFDRLSKDLKKLMGVKQFTRNSPMGKVFNRLIRDQKINKARASMELITANY